MYKYREVGLKICAEKKETALKPVEEEEVVPGKSTGGSTYGSHLV